MSSGQHTHSQHSVRHESPRFTTFASQGLPASPRASSIVGDGRALAGLLLGSDHALLSETAGWWRRSCGPPRAFRSACPRDTLGTCGAPSDRAWEVPTSAATGALLAVDSRLLATESASQSSTVGRPSAAADRSSSESSSGKLASRQEVLYRAVELNLVRPYCAFEEWRRRGGTEFTISRFFLPPAAGRHVLTSGEAIGSKYVHASLLRYSPGWTPRRGLWRVETSTAAMCSSCSRLLTGRAWSSTRTLGGPSYAGRALYTRETWIPWCKPVRRRSSATGLSSPHWATTQSPKCFATRTGSAPTSSTMSWGRCSAG